MKKLLIVFGTRPEAIKMAPLVLLLKNCPEEFNTVVCVTGQHREMLDQVLHIFNIKPDYDLNIMKDGQDLYDVTCRVLQGMKEVLKEVQPDLVLVHGDTTTSTAAALSAFYQQIAVGHVEAGLRTHNIYSPWPEEMNRQLTGRIASYHFAPTAQSRQNLLDEGIRDTTITITGNTVIDALQLVVDKLHKDSSLAQTVRGHLIQAGYDISRLDCGRKLVLITGHRRENFGKGSACAKPLKTSPRNTLMLTSYTPCTSIPMYASPSTKYSQDWTPSQWERVGVKLTISSSSNRLNTWSLSTSWKGQASC